MPNLERRGIFYEKLSEQYSIIQSFKIQSLLLIYRLIINRKNNY